VVDTIRLGETARIEIEYEERGNERRKAEQQRITADE
jgi:hypothetical protein